MAGLSRFEQPRSTRPPEGGLVRIRPCNPCPHSSSVNSEALPPAAVVLMVSVRSLAKRSR